MSRKHCNQNRRKMEENHLPKTGANETSDDKNLFH